MFGFMRSIQMNFLQDKLRLHWHGKAISCNTVTGEYSHSI